MISRQKQIKLSQNKGKPLLSGFVKDLAIRLNKDEKEVTLLDIKTTIDLLDKFRERMSHLRDNEDFAVKYCWSFTNIVQAQKLLAYLEKHMPNRPMIMYRRLSEYCGAVEIYLTELLQKSFDLVELDEEDYIAYDLQGDISIIFDFYTDFLEGGKSSEKVYELRLRGREWKAILKDALLL